jgi:hypothetical protein
MADISRFLFVHHLRANPTAHVRHLRNGEVAHEGAGQAFWFRPLTAALSEVPIDDREQPLLFHGRTADFQDVTVQATITYRVADPATAALRIDFGIDPDGGRWRSRPLEQVGGLLTELAQQHALDLLVGMTQVQQDADKATYERRALAVERERAIAENELQNQIELARREEQLVEQQGQNERKRAAEQAAAGQIRAEASAGEQRLLADAQADATRAVGMAEADAEAARLAAYRELDAATILGLAAQELAGHLPAIGTLNLTPDVLTTLLGRLTAGTTVAAGTTGER